MRQDNPIGFSVIRECYQIELWGINTVCTVSLNLITLFKYLGYILCIAFMLYPLFLIPGRCLPHTIIVVDKYLLVGFQGSYRSYAHYSAIPKDENFISSMPEAISSNCQLILKANFKVFIWTKKQTKIFCISALAYKKRSDQKSSACKRVKIKSSN